MITTHSCRETINATAREYKYHLPICVKYISKPDDIPELKQYFNITRIIIKNKTNIINQTNWIDRINWINQTRWINQTNIVNKTRCINETRRIAEKKEPVKKRNESFVAINKEYERGNENKENRTKIKWDLNNILVLGGISFGGLVVLSITFYIAWKCWLREKIEGIIIDYFFCGYGEKVMEILEFLGCIKEGWEKRREETIYEPYLIGLSDKEREVVMGQIKKNKARLDAATDLVWKDLCESATRPRDEYHKNLLENSIYNNNNNIEVEEVRENIILEIKPGTPRRRRRIMEI
jgi:hypothetical protein